MSSVAMLKMRLVRTFNNTEFLICGLAA